MVLLWQCRLCGCSFPLVNSDTAFYFLFSNKILTLYLAERVVSSDDISAQRKHGVPGGESVQKGPEGR